MSEKTIKTQYFDNAYDFYNTDNFLSQKAIEKEDLLKLNDEIIIRSQYSLIDVDGTEKRKLDFKIYKVSKIEKMIDRFNGGNYYFVRRYLLSEIIQIKRSVIFEKTN